VTKPVRWTYDKRDAVGRVIDLHALRHTFGTRLGMNPAIDPKSIQTLMRHSTPTLTFKLYVHPNKERLRNAVASLPEIKAGDGGETHGDAAKVAV
jgi:integrase